MNAMKFLETIADPKTSLEFNKLKGSCRSAPTLTSHRCPLPAAGIEGAVQ